jgi:tetratricopeptide (TPR) repeat protein
MWCSISISWGQGTVQENDWLTIYQLGMKYKDTSNNKKALQLLEQAYELHPSDSIKRDIASVYYDRGIYRKSINICQELLKRDSLEADLVLIAKSHEKLNNADSALVYEKIIAKKNIENANNIINLAKKL